MLISETSKTYNIKTDTLRYYERIGLIPSVPRDKNGIRHYDEETCHWIEYIKYMRSAGVSNEVLLKYMVLYHQGDSTASQRKQLLIEQREKLVNRIHELNDVLYKLDWKIGTYTKIK